MFQLPPVAIEFAQIALYKQGIAAIDQAGSFHGCERVMVKGLGLFKAASDVVQCGEVLFNSHGIHMFRPLQANSKCQGLGKQSLGLVPLPHFTIE